MEEYFYIEELLGEELTCYFDHIIDLLALRLCLLEQRAINILLANCQAYSMMLRCFDLVYFILFVSILLLGVHAYTKNEDFSSDIKIE